MTALIIFFGLLFAGLPIVATILAGAVAFMATNDLSVLFDSIPIQFYGALEINSLLAIPLFLLVGEIMNKGGLTQRLIAVTEVLVGGLRGGWRTPTSSPTPWPPPSSARPWRRSAS